MKESPTVESIIQAHVTKYRRAGFNVVRLKGKAPWQNDWQHKSLEPDDFLETDGIGLHHGPSGTCAIDIDDLEAATEVLGGLNIHIDELLEAENAVQIISGRDNRAKLLYAVPEGFKPRRIPFTNEKGMILELRGGLGCQDVLPPSRHPDTKKAYRWGGAGSFRRLPILPKALRLFWQFEMDKRRATQKHHHPDGEKPWHFKSAFQKAEAIAALQAIPAIGSVDFGDGPAKWSDAQWVKLGFAFVDASGGGEGMFEQFAAWCSEDQREFDEDHLWARWSSWHRKGAVNAATLFRWANVNDPDWKPRFLTQWYIDHPDEAPEGYVGDTDVDEEDDEVIIDDVDYEGDEFKEYAEELDYVGWIACPGYMTKIANSLLAASSVPRPQLCVFGAIMIMSASLNGHYRWPDGLRMNMYGTALVPTGGGKDVLRRGLDEMSKHAGFMVAGRPASRTALHDMLQPYRSVFLEIDEAAHGSIGQEAKTDRHKQGLDGAILQAFSASASSVNTSKHAGQDDGRRVEHPYLGVMGLSTAAMYAKTIGEEEVMSGMMNRHLFIVEDEHVDLAESQGELVFDADTIKRAKRINSAIGKTEPDEDGVVTRIGDIVLTIDKGATARLNMVRGALNEERRSAFRNDETKYALIARKYELVKRLAGVFAVWDNPREPVVKVKHVDWADQYVSISNIAMMKFMRKDVMGATESGMADRVLAVMKRALNGDLKPQGTSKVKAAQQAAIDQGSVSRTTIANAVQGWIGKDGTRTLNNLLELLITQGKIEKVVKKAEGRGRPSEQYRLAK